MNLVLRFLPPDTGKAMGDVIFVLSLALVVWFAVNYDGGGDGGRGARVPVGISH
jgi:hypothetical protein